MKTETPVSNLGVGKTTKEIVRALAKDVELLILDDQRLP